MELVRKGLVTRFLRLFVAEFWKHVWGRVISAVSVIGALVFSLATGKLSAQVRHDNLPSALIPLVWAISLLVLIHIVRAAFLLCSEIHREQTNAKPTMKVSSVLTPYGTPAESWVFPHRIRAYRTKVAGIALCFATIPISASYICWGVAGRIAAVPPGNQVAPVAKTNPPSVPGILPSSSSARPAQSNKQRTDTNKSRMESSSAPDNSQTFPGEDINPHYREVKTPEIRTAADLFGMSSEELRKYAAEVVKTLRIFDAGWFVPGKMMQIQEPSPDDPQAAIKLGQEVERRQQRFDEAQAHYKQQFDLKFPNMDVIADELIQRCQQKGVSADVQYEKFQTQASSPFPPPYVMGTSGLVVASYLEALTRKCL